MFVALQLNEDELIEDIFTKCSDLSMRKQLSYILGRQQRFLELGEDIAEAEELQGRIKNIFSLDRKFLTIIFKKESVERIAFIFITDNRKLCLTSTLTQIFWH